MYAYSMVQIKDQICRNILNTQKREEYSQFFSAENIINNLGVKTFYNHDERPSVLISQADVAKVCLLASSKFGREIKYKELLPNISKLIEMPIDQKGVQRHDVKTFQDAIPIITAHRENSTYYKLVNEKERLKKQQHDLMFKEFEDERKRKAALFQKRSNLNIDFENKKIACIDFEFNASKKGLEAATEFGISIYENGKIQNFHFLIEENYKSKGNRELQKKFKFGTTQYIFKKDVVKKMNELFQNTDYFLFHELSGDNKLLKEMGINLEQRENCELIDTQIYFQTHFRDKEAEIKSPTLKGLLEAFNIPSQSLHNSGNDAAYTLKLFQGMLDEYRSKEVLKPDEPTKKMSSKFKMS
jgi:hypothetical protein